MGEMIKKMLGNFKRYSLYLVVEIVVLISQFTIFYDGTSEVIAERSIRTGSGLSLLGSIIIFFISPLLAGYLATINKNLLLGKRKKFTEELCEGVSYYWRVLGGTLLVALMILGVTILMIFLTFIPLIGILGVIAGFIFIIYLSVKYSAIAEAIVYREFGVTEGMDTCKDVTSEHFWELFILTIPVGILTFIAAFIEGVGVLFVISIIIMLYSIFASYYRIDLISTVYGEDYNEDAEEKEDGYPRM